MTLWDCKSNCLKVKPIICWFASCTAFVESIRYERNVEVDVLVDVLAIFILRLGFDLPVQTLTPYFAYCSKSSRKHPLSVPISINWCCLWQITVPKDISMKQKKQPYWIFMRWLSSSLNIHPYGTQAHYKWPKLHTHTPIWNWKLHKKDIFTNWIKSFVLHLTPALYYTYKKENQFCLLKMPLLQDVI